MTFPFPEVHFFTWGKEVHFLQILRFQSGLVPCYNLPLNRGLENKHLKACPDCCNLINLTKRLRHCLNQGDLCLPCNLHQADKHTLALLAGKSPAPSKEAVGRKTVIEDETPKTSV